MGFVASTWDNRDGSIESFECEGACPEPAETIPPGSSETSKSNSGASQKIFPRMGKRKRRRKRRRKKRRKKRRKRRKRRKKRRKRRKKKMRMFLLSPNSSP